MLTSLSALDWLRLAAVLLLFAGPGAAFVSFYPQRRSISRTGCATLSILFALAAWPVLLAWLQLFKIKLPAPAIAVVFAATWLIALWRGRRSGRPRFVVPPAERILLWLIVILVAGAGVFSLRNLVVGPGSDAYHHTLITQLIVDNGGLPSNYLPYSPLLSFTYHFGFHAFAAAVTQLTGLPAQVVVPVLAQVLVGVAALAVAYMTETFTKSRLAGVVSAAVAAFVAVFPAYLINYGRYTQLTGTLLLAGLLAVIYEWREARWNWGHVPFVALLSAGIAVTHYRVTLMAGSAIVVIFGVGLLLDRTPWREWQRLVVRWVAAGGLAFLMVSPWVIHVLSQRHLGYSLATSTPGPSFFSLSRFGPVVLGYPTNTLLLVLLCLSVLAALILRDRNTLLMVAWSIVMLAASTPLLSGAFMDTISVIISLFVPVAFVIGSMVARVAGVTPRVERIGRPVVLVVMSILCLASLPRQATIADPNGAFVRPDDVAAIDWIRANTPESALFLGNTYHWDFMPDFIIGIDGGFWLPLLAGRQTVTMPMTFSIERGARPDLLKDLVSLDGFEGQLTSPEAIGALHAAGVNYIFTGAQGGKIDRAALASSPAFELLFTSGAAQVFAVR